MSSTCGSHSTSDTRISSSAADPHELDTAAREEQTAQAAFPKSSAAVRVYKESDEAADLCGTLGPKMSVRSPAEVLVPFYSCYLFMKWGKAKYPSRRSFARRAGSK